MLEVVQITRKQIEIYEGQIADKKLSEQLLYACLAKIEPQINRAAYFKKHCTNQYEMELSQSEFNTQINNRRLICRALIQNNFTIPSDKKVDKDLEVTHNIVKKVIKLLGRGDYDIEGEST